MANIDKSVPGQVRYLDPYNQRIYDFNTQDNRVYLTRNINNVLKVIGNDIAVGGLQVTNLSASGNTLNVAILPGLLIQDETLIEITEDTYLSLNCDLFNDSGMAIIHTHWNWINTPEPNLFQLRMSWISNDGNTIYNSPWEENKDRIILGAIQYWKDPNNSIYKYQFYTGRVVTILGKEYYIRNAQSSPLRGVVASLNHYLFDEGNAPEYIGNIYKMRAINGNIVLSTATMEQYETDL